MKQTVLTENGNSYQQEINGLDIEGILERILTQTQQHLDDDEGNIYDDEEDQLDKLIEAIEEHIITDDNFEEYLSLWEPEVIRDETGSRTTVSLTVYDDGSSRFRCYIPGTFFQIFEY